MSTDLEFDDSWSAQPCELFPSPRRPRTDTVHWLNSQPPPGLREIMLTGPKSLRHDRELKHQASCTSHQLSEKEQTASKSCGPPPPRSRPLTRTNSSSRVRSHSKSNADLSTVPPNASSTKDHDALLRIFKGVSEQLDENVANRVAQIKRKGRHSTPGTRTVPKARRTSTPQPTRSSCRVLTTADTKGKGKEITEKRIPAPYTNRTSSLSSSSSSFSTNVSIMEVDTPDTSMMNIDVDSGSTLEYGQDRQTLRDSQGPANLDGSPPFNPVTPAPKMHPLLQEQQSRRQKPVPQRAKCQVLPQPVSNVLSSSQSTRPPSLGMRRFHTLPTAAQQNLPTHQKGFKPPLSQPQAPSGVQAQPLSNPPLKLGLQEEWPKALHVRSRTVFLDEGEDLDRQRPHPVPSRESSPEARTEADSSFGDMSFDMDALEETMRQYD